MKKTTKPKEKLKMYTIQIKSKDPRGGVSKFQLLESAVLSSVSTYMLKSNDYKSITITK
jgi:hypothetical protein